MAVLSVASVRGADTGRAWRRPVGGMRAPRQADAFWGGVGRLPGASVGWGPRRCFFLFTRAVPGLASSALCS